MKTKLFRSTIQPSQSV